jgi:hypothetical protein
MYSPALHGHTPDGESCSRYLHADGACSGNGKSGSADAGHEDGGESGGHAAGRPAANGEAITHPAAAEPAPPAMHAHAARPTAPDASVVVQAGQGEQRLASFAGR